MIQQLGSQPRTVAEFDADGSPVDPKIHEFPVRFTTETAGISLDYAYAIPSVLENFWMQGNDKFARPELLIDWFEIEGPVFDAWPPSSHKAVFGDAAKNAADEDKYARDVLSQFMRRAWRRPIQKDELDIATSQFKAARKDRSLVEAIKIPLTSILTSPNFLYLVEPTAGPSGESLNDHQLAARLSYFLWSSMPDEELAKLADSGYLKNPNARAQQVDRMLSDPRADNFVKNFAGQWLGLRLVGANPPLRICILSTIAIWKHRSWRNQKRTFASSCNTISMHVR